MTVRDRVRTRLTALLGLDFDFEIDMGRKPLSAINDVLFVGRRPSPDEGAGLREAGITHVISALPESERSEMAFLRSAYQCLFVPLHDGIHEDIASAFSAAFEFIGAASEDAASKVLVHCEVGVSRSATIAIAWLMKSEGAMFFDAVTRAREMRPQILPNIGFASQLQRLEHRLQGVDLSGPSSLARYLRHVCNVPVELDVLEELLARNDYDAPRALETLFGGEIPRVVQGVRR